MIMTVTASGGVFHVCKFNPQTLSFGGSPAQQAACLLGDNSARLPPLLRRLIGKGAGNIKGNLKAYLSRYGISQASIGGSIDQPITPSRGGFSHLPVPRYFVIHDTSSPVFRNARRFPANLNYSPAINSLDKYMGPESPAHVFVNRLGASMTGHDFEIPWRATKFEMRILRDLGSGMFLHVELVQPRRTDGKGKSHAPSPGFTRRQYERLALVYAAASARVGKWLIPALHSRIDREIRGAHTDPHNFRSGDFARALGALLARLNRQS